jgi:hypothetical protein
MKKLIVFCLLFTGSVFGQIGVINLKISDSIFYDQWYTIDHEDHKNSVYFLSTKEVVDSMVTALLKPWDLTLKDGEYIEEDKGTLWNLDNMNGFSCNLFVEKYDEKGNDYFITIYTYLQSTIPDEDENEKKN